MPVYVGYPDLKVGQMTNSFTQSLIHNSELGTAKATKSHCPMKTQISLYSLFTGHTMISQGAKASSGQGLI